jgi:radical SAM protein with 4Fe4S-binding SPASM domain
MKYFLSKEAVLKSLEMPSVYHLIKDDLYELDDTSFAFLARCASGGGCMSNDREFIEFCLSEGILTPEKITLQRPPLLNAPVPSLRYLELQITSRCNLRCRHCYIDGKERPELRVSEIRDVLTQFQEMQGLRVLITGGEPLLHKGFFELNEMLPEFFLRKVLFTNGVLKDRGILKKLNVQEVQVSIDGLEDAHDSLRGYGTFRAAMETIRNALDAGLEVSVSTMVHAQNLDDFERMDSLFRETGIKDWAVDIPCMTGRMKENPEWCVTPEEAGKYFRFGFGEGLHSGSEGFGCGLHLMAVLADGRVAKCTFFGDSAVGTIRDRLSACWERIAPVVLANLACDCDHLEECRGGCRYRALLLGNPMGKDLYKCAYYDRMDTF